MLQHARGEHRPWCAAEDEAVSKAYALYLLGSAAAGKGYLSTLRVREHIRPKLEDRCSKSHPVLARTDVRYGPAVISS